MCTDGQAATTGSPRSGLHRLSLDQAQHQAARRKRHVVDRCDCHPDEFTEYIRWLICEGELLQGLGRMRAVNRDADTPVDIDISNVVLPIDVDEAMQWRTPSELIETAMEGPHADGTGRHDEVTARILSAWHT